MAILRLEKEGFLRRLLDDLMHSREPEARLLGTLALVHTVIITYYAWTQGLSVLSTLLLTLAAPLLGLLLGGVTLTVGWALLHPLIRRRHYGLMLRCSRNPVFHAAYIAWCTAAFWGVVAIARMG